MLALLSLTILQGDRYEGFFSNNKFDGQGSYYERDAISGKVTATHGTWQVNLPYKPLSRNPYTYSNGPKKRTMHILNITYLLYRCGRCLYEVSYVI